MLLLSTYIVVALQLAPLTFVLAYPFEINDAECDSMLPRSLGVDAQSGKGPYTMTISSTIFDYEGEVHIDIEATGRNSNIRGLFLQARKADCARGNGKPVGTFRTMPGAHKIKVVNCSGGINNAVINDKWIPHNHVKVRWFAPPRNIGPVFFRATIVESKEKIWIENYSETTRPLNTQHTGTICPARQVQKPGNSGSKMSGSMFYMSVYFCIFILTGSLKLL